ncbi:MAG: GFA family protein [Rhodospirillales bacterium]|nr:MAG: GFA family protein [Rhodospirillales bacterium]
MSKQSRYTGGCLCGEVRYRILGPLRDAVACHCTQCRRMTGHYAAFAACGNERLVIESGARLAWYESSPGVRRGFCAGCGSTLFWDDASRPYIAVAAGSLDAPTGIRLSAHSFTERMGDYYAIADGLPRYPGRMA